MSAPDPLFVAQVESGRQLVVVLAIGYNKSVDVYAPPTRIERYFAVSDYGTYLPDGVTEINAPGDKKQIDGALKSLSASTLSIDPITRSGWARDSGGSATITNAGNYLAHWKQYFFDGRRFEVRVGFHGENWSQYKTVWGGLIKGEPVFSDDEITVTLEAPQRFVNKAIDGEAVGGTDVAKDERLPVVIGHARSMPLKVYDKATLRYRVTGSTFWADNPNLRWKDVCAVHVNARPLHRAAGFTLTLSGVDDYVSNVAHNMAAGDLIDWSVLGVRRYRYVLASGLTPTQFKVSTTFGGAAEAHSVVPVPVDVYNYAVEAGQIIRLAIDPGASQPYADVTCANIIFIRPYAAGVGNFPYKTSKIGRVIESLAVTYGGLATWQFDATSFDAADATYADASYAARMVTTSAERINVLNEIGDLASAVGAYVFFDNEKLKCGFMHGVPAAPVVSLSNAWLTGSQDVRYERLVPDAKNITLRYLRNELPHTDFVGLTTETERLERATQYPRSVTTPDASWWERFPRVDGRTYLVPITAADASGPALAAAISNLAINRRDATNSTTWLVRLVTHISTLGLSIGDVVTVPWRSAWVGSSEPQTRNGWIVGKTVDAMQRKITYDVVVRYV